LDRKKLVTSFMELRRPLYILAVLWGGSIAILWASQASAGLRCDCTQVIDTCSASVSLNDMQVSIESDNKACSRVDYLIEGQPFAALIVGGSSQLEWSGQPMRNPQIVIENCRVCADASAGGLAASTGLNTTGGEPAMDGEAAAVVKIMPSYPREAWMDALEGDVIVEFGVSAAGEVENIKVTKATNQAFINNTIDAVSRFRYAPARKNGAAVATTGNREKFSFRILGGVDPVVTSAAH
jgi:TonB family protein